MAPRFDPKVNSVAYNVGATTLMRAFSALRSASLALRHAQRRADVHDAGRRRVRPARPRAMGPNAE